MLPFSLLKFRRRHIFRIILIRPQMQIQVIPLRLILIRRPKQITMPRQRQLRRLIRHRWLIQLRRVLSRRLILHLRRCRPRRSSLSPRWLLRPQRSIGEQHWQVVLIVDRALRLVGPHLVDLLSDPVAIRVIGGSPVLLDSLFERGLVVFVGVVGVVDGVVACEGVGLAGVGVVDGGVAVDGEFGLGLFVLEVLGVHLVWGSFASVASDESVRGHQSW